MNFFRKIVSGKRNRLKEKNYDLDITYVTKRVAGMSFPASGFEQCYRNNINNVRRRSKILSVGSSVPRGKASRRILSLQPLLQEVRLQKVQKPSQGVSLGGPSQPSYERTVRSLPGHVRVPLG
jgi:hypothetical protein